jgi:glycosyltransferase involved in cell wall biosynthesis
VADGNNLLESAAEAGSDGVRAIFYLLDGDSNASSRQRVLQFLPWLRREGIEGVVSRPGPQGVYERLVERGSGRLSEKVGFYASFLGWRLKDVLHAGQFDVAVVQRDLFPFGPPLLERLLMQRANSLVYDTDDATYLRPGFTPNTPMQRLRRFDKVAEVVRRARWVSVATEPIATWARQHNPRVDVLPMCVDLAEYDAVSRQDSQARGQGLVLGWAGTAGGLSYLERLGPVLRELAQERELVVRVVSGGYRRVTLPGVPLDARPWRGLADLASFDIGLVPLDDTPFERAKFPFKLLQYLALGVPAVAARVGVAAEVIQDGHNGLLAGSADEWREQLRRLMADAELRQRLARTGRQTVEERYTLERVAPRLVRGLLGAAAR